ncbi:hypothetical protein BLS_007519 [Venturia inaequalis]|uniref:Uncharacterized protein n=1 Tax=Venturia inaequalis TaxID=5025 RepID=A0A8H3U919_VENIN|nr:hypothetical protein BLS_007519 [Venturia inaequalis]KAE9970886.1 hypothetical protein EG328_005984 [Venturia inaequalis]KAE9979915.1 hypothetical protein EG327_006861 [Venturia inaequalis]RDI81127.1 hypothetical protein Vi05172_g9007 [Venturia inaequalis]
MSDVKKIMKNLDDLERKVTKSNKIAQKGEKMGYGDAIKLGRKSNSITSTINKGVKDYDGVTPSEADVKKILAQMTKIVELTEEQLNALVANKSRFDTLKVGGLVKKNMAKTSDASILLEKTMLEKTPAEIKPQAEALSARREAAFKKAIDAFAGASGGEDQADGEDDSD